MCIRDRRMSTPFADREIWFLVGSQDMYGEETLRQVAEQSQAVARALDEATAVPVRVVWKPVLKDSDAIRRMALEANAADACIGVIAWICLLYTSDAADDLTR